MTVTRVSDFTQNQLLIAELTKANQAGIQDRAAGLERQEGANFKDCPIRLACFVRQGSVDRNTHYTQTVTELLAAPRRARTAA